MSKLRYRGPKEDTQPIVEGFRPNNSSGKAPSRNGSESSLDTLNSGRLSTGSVSDVPPAQLSIDQDKGKRKKSWRTRVFWSWSLVLGFWGILLTTRQIGCTVLVIICMTWMYAELVNLLYEEDKERKLPYFRFFSSYWFFVSFTYAYGLQLEEHLLKQSFESILGGIKVSTVTQHFKGICFALYSIGLVAFVITLRRRRYYAYQFTQFAYCHIVCLAIVVQSSFMIYTMWEGILWFLLPVALVVANDCFAYIFGFFFGKTRLIPKLSPKKTVEGFIGGLFATIVFSIVLPIAFASPMSPIRGLLLCPKSDGLKLDLLNPSAAFAIQCNELNSTLYQYFPLPDYIPKSDGWGPLARVVFAVVRPITQSLFLPYIHIMPLQVHSFLMGLFASVVAPFGGFFASGLKRALRIKDFGRLIPGHGGITDRMDCQLIMGTFAMVYYCQWIEHHYFPDHATDYAWSIIQSLPKGNKQALYQRLRDNI